MSTTKEQLLEKENLREELYGSQRNEQVRDILDRMPTSFTAWVVGVVVILVIALLLIGYFVKWPDVVLGQVRISAKQQPVTMVAQSRGKLQLLGVSPQQPVQAGTYLAVLENPASTEQVQQLEKELTAFTVGSAQQFAQSFSLLQRPLLGDIEPYYFNFYNRLQEYVEYLANDPIQLRLNALQSLVQNNEQLLGQRRQIRATRLQKLAVAQKQLEVDSALYAKDAILQPQFQRAQVAYYNNVEQLQGIESEILSTQSRIAELQAEVLQIQNDKRQQERQLTTRLQEAYRDLLVQIANWERAYVFEAPQDGQVEFLQFWGQNQFVNANEAVFSIVPAENNVTGQLYMPAAGAGKVEVGQKVNIKLDNYPHDEYGIVEGQVKIISLVTNQDIYLIDVELPNGLTTSFDQELGFNYGMKGIAEIVTQDKRLIQRLYERIQSGLNAGDRITDEQIEKARENAAKAR